MNTVVALIVSFLGMFAFQPSPKQVPASVQAIQSSLITGEKVWKTEYEDARIAIQSCLIVYTAPGNAIQHERVIFRYTNRTANGLKVSFGRKMLYNGVCYGCDKSDKNFLVVLSAHQSKEFSEENKDKTFYIFSKDMNHTITKTLDTFELTNIVVQ